jgi:hypothetical protein
VAIGRGRRYSKSGYIVAVWNNPIVSVKVAIFINLIFLINAHGSVHDLLDISLDFFNEVLLHKTGSIIDVGNDIFMPVLFVNLSHHSHLRRVALKQGSFLSGEIASIITANDVFRSRR